MPLTPEELDDAARNPKATSGDSGSLTERDADELLALQAAADHARQQAAATAAGKAPSLWASIGKARSVPPGAV